MELGPACVPPLRGMRSGVHWACKPHEPPNAHTISADKINQGLWREERRLSFPREEESSRNVSVRNRQKANTFGRFSVRAQPPGA